MRGGMRFSRSWALPEKMISMPRISAPPQARSGAATTPDHRKQSNGQATAAKRTAPVMESFQSLQQGPSSEYSYRQAFGKA